MTMGISTPEAAGSALLLHCSAGSGRQWDKLARLLDGGFDVAAPDLYGYGEADQNASGASPELLLPGPPAAAGAARGNADHRAAASS